MKKKIVSMRKSIVTAAFVLSALAASASTVVPPSAYVYEVAAEDVFEVDEIYPTKTSVKTINNINLAEWQVVGGALKGGSCQSTSDNGVSADAFYECFTNGICDVWLCGADGQNVKGVQIRLWQDGDTVKVKGLDAAYKQFANATTANERILTGNFNLENDRTGTMNVASSGTAANYGAKKIILKRRGSLVSPDDVYAQGDTVEVKKYAEVKIDSPVAFVTAVPVMTAAAKSKITLSNLGDATFGDVFRGRGEFCFESPEVEVLTNKCEGVWNYGASKNVIVSENKSLRDIVEVTADALYYSSTSNLTVRPFYFTNNGTVATVQMQCEDSDYVRCIFVQLTQYGNNIKVETLTGNAYYKSKGKLGHEFNLNDRSTYTGSVGLQQPGNGYGLWNIGVVFGNNRREINLDSQLRYSNCTNQFFTVGTNVALKIDNKDALPYQCRMVVAAGGSIEAFAAGEVFYGYSGGKGSYEILEGGEMNVRNGHVFSSYNSQSVLVRGGVINFIDPSYLNFVTLEDGAVIAGAPYLGYASNPEWKIRGSSPSYVQNGLILSEGANDRTMTIDVADVTGNEEPDFVIGGTMKDLQSSQVRVSIKKTGAGTVAIDGKCTYAKPTYIDDGVWLIRSNATTDGTKTISLRGGTLALADSTTNSFAALKLSQSSAIQLGENANLSFADTSAESWSDGVRLAITVPDLLNFAIRFGDSASALTPAQISRIRLNRMSVVLDESGYLRVRDGLKIIVR